MGHQQLNILFPRPKAFTASRSRCFVKRRDSCTKWDSQGYRRCLRCSRSFFDGLYRAGVIEEGCFEMWSILSSDDTPGKTSAMFQVNDFLEWLRTAKVEGEESSEEDENSGSDDSSDEDDDEDILANVPTRR